jgi:predicted DNA-binding protein (UPF0251 family)
MTTLHEAAQQWHLARVDERRLAARLHEAIRLEVASGMSESEAARVAKIDRMTVRRALGKL